MATGAASDGCRRPAILVRGVKRAMRCVLQSSAITVMIRAIDGFDDFQAMSEKTLNLRGLKCPLPALRTKKALGGLVSGDVLVVECTDPLAGVDIPNLLNQTGDKLEDTIKDKRLQTFRIRKK